VVRPYGLFTPVQRSSAILRVFLSVSRASAVSSCPEAVDERERRGRRGGKQSPAQSNFADIATTDSAAVAHVPSHGVDPDNLSVAATTTTSPASHAASTQTGGFNTDPTSNQP